MYARTIFILEARYNQPYTLALFYTPDEGRQDVEAMKPECKCMQDAMVLDKSGNESWPCQVERI